MRFPTKCATSKVRKTAMVINLYDQEPHLSQNTKWESNKITINITNNSQRVSPFPIGDHKAAVNGRESMVNIRALTTQMIHKRSTALERSVKIVYCRA